MNSLFIPGLTAAADYSTSGQYCPVYLSASRVVTTQVADGGTAIGVLQNAPTAGAAAEVVGLGYAKGLLGDTVTAGQLLAAEVTTGRLIPCNAAGEYAIAVALASGSDGEIIDIFVTHTGEDSD